MWSGEGLPAAHDPVANSARRGRAWALAAPRRASGLADPGTSAAGMTQTDNESLCPGN